jgi:cell division protein FtsN
MKLAIGVTLLMLAIGAPTYALQEPDKDKEKPPKQEEPRKQEPERQQPPEKEKPPQEKPQEKQPQRDTQKPDKEQTDRARQAEKQQQQNEKQQQQTVKQEQQTEKDRATQEQSQRDEHNNVQPAQRDAGNRNVRRIPDQDFRTHFGREHAFRVARRDDRRFNYGGYWFEYSQPWPAGWSYDDNVYVDDIDGEYYLIDLVHPGLRLLLIVAS